MSEPRRTGLLNMLGSSMGSQFIIPVYQRNYTWNADKEVKQYLNDLRGVLEGKYKNHFLGIIIYLEKSIDFSTRELSVIDGQQRLTTTFLMMYAAKKILKEEGQDDKVNQLEGQYLTNPHHSDKIKFKLKPLVSDDDVYRCIVEDNLDAVTDLNSNVYKNFKYIEDYLRNLISEGYTTNDILLALDKLYVVTVPISEEDNAQKIFESINATGVKLTSADLIRNYLLMGLDSDTQEKFYTQYWRKLEEHISQNSRELELFFRMFLAVKMYNLVAKSAVYRSFVEWNENGNYQTEDLFKELLEYAQIYNDIVKKDINTLPIKMRPVLTDFRKVNSEIPISLIMGLYKTYKENEIDVKILSDLIHVVNTYMIRRSICDMDSQNISRLFPQILKKVQKECSNGYEDIINVLNQELVGNNANTSGSYMPTDKQMHEILKYANVYKRPALRIILDRLELHENAAPVDLSMLSIEHLMPQTPTEEWLEELETDEETYYENLHRLGNLTLAAVHDNSIMGNMGWEFKNEILKGTSHIKLNTELFDIEKWNLKEIDIRTDELIKRICEVYPYPEVEISNDNSTIISEIQALDYAKSKVITEQNIEVIRKRRIYKTNDNITGYIFASSKMYLQGNREKYWFGYRESKFNEIINCENQYIVLVCRDKEVVTLKIPKSFIEEQKERLNTSVYDDGSVSHYHMHIFIDDDKAYMSLSKPDVSEIDISEFII